MVFGKGGGGDASRGRGATRLAIAGAFDAKAVISARATAEAAVASSSDVEIDLAEATSIDGSGVGLLAFLRKRLLPEGRRVIVVGASHQVREELERLGIARILMADREGRPSPARALLGSISPAWARA